MDNPVRELSNVICKKISELNIDLDTKKLVTNFMEISLIDLAYLLSAKEDSFDITDIKDLDYVYLFDLERNMFWKGTHGYTSSIRDAMLFPFEVAKNKSNEYNSNTKIVFFEGANW